MYLTEITLQDEAAARLFPSNPYNWHRTVWKFFPNRQQRDFLYRVDYNSRGLRLMILSAERPLSPFSENCAVFKCREIPESFFSHTFYRFQIRVNPTKRIMVDARTGQRVEGGMRVPVTGDRELIAWLSRKGQTAGFSLPSLAAPDDSRFYLSVLPEPRLQFKKKENARAHHASVQFTGILRVEDEGMFRRAFAKGIGSAKSFGFGLLMLQPLI